MEERTEGHNLDFWSPEKAAKERPLTISLLLPDLRGGGAERVSIDLARALDALGHEVNFILMRAEGEFLEEAKQNFSVIDLGVGRTRQVPIVLARALDDLRPDALIANMWPLSSAAVVARKLCRITPRLILVDHSTLSNHYASRGRLHELMLRVSLRMTYCWADAIVAVSAGAARDLEELSGVDAGTVKVLHNPIAVRPAPNKDGRAAAECIWGPCKGPRILTVGNLKDVKNHRLLLRAFARLPESDARLMLLGQGQNEAMLRDLALKLGIGDRVIFAGFQPDPTPFYATADLFVLSSDYEGFGNVIVEALGQGLPVVSTDCPSGPAEILEGGRWGRLVPVGDEEALARAIDEALSSKHDRIPLQRRAADFAPEIAAKKYLALMFPEAR